MKQLEIKRPEDNPLLIQKAVEHLQNALECDSHFYSTFNRRAVVVRFFKSSRLAGDYGCPICYYSLKCSGVSSTEPDMSDVKAMGFVVESLSDGEFPSGLEIEIESCTNWSRRPSTEKDPPSMYL